ncbi:MAG: hypothetical protein KAK00_05640 [Nanoarchaeota archaeon]|nr:hypothetical protein [Nanoarchaeota archaeon]
MYHTLSIEKRSLGSIILDINRESTLNNVKLETMGENSGLYMVIADLELTGLRNKHSKKTAMEIESEYPLVFITEREKNYSVCFLIDPKIHYWNRKRDSKVMTPIIDKLMNIFDRYTT